MNLLICGARGFLGAALAQAFPRAAVPSIDIADRRAVAEILNVLCPDIVINAAGKTGRPNIDWCETHREETYRANVTGPRVLVEECDRREIYFVHLSSGCVYDGDNNGIGFDETDTPNFLCNFYTKTKAWAEQLLRDFPVLILRPRMPFDGTGHQRNLIIKLLGYSRVLDVQNSMTYVPDFVTATQALLDRRAVGVYHVVNPGSISPLEIRNCVRHFAAAGRRFDRLESNAILEVARVPRSNCILNTDKLTEVISLVHVHEAIMAAVEMMSHRTIA